MPKLLELLVESLGILDEILFDLEELSVLIERVEQIAPSKDNLSDIDKEHYDKLIDIYANKFMDIHDLLHRIH